MTAPPPPRPSRRAKAVKPVKAWGLLEPDGQLLNWMCLKKRSAESVAGEDYQVVPVWIVPVKGYRVVRVKGKPAPASGKGKGGKRK